VRHPTRAKARQRQVLQAMFRNRFITRAERDELIKRPLAFQKSFSGIDVDFAPWFLDQVREDANKILGTDIKGSSLVIRTTLDPHLQKFAVNAIREGSDNFRRFERGGRVEAALLATNHATGAILAMAGGRDYRTSQFNRATSARRHPGSAFKTFVYALALQQGWTWSDRLFIDPVQINGYKPRNLTDEFFTEMTLLRSFYRSLNTPAVEVAHKLGVGNVIQFAEKLGVRSPLKHELGTALGGSSVTLQDMAAAYGTIANGGQLREPYTIESISKRGGEALYSHNSRKNPDSGVIDPQTAWLVTEGLRAVMRHGTASGAAQLANMAVGKTGTSNEGVDSWFAGYTATITAIVWSGRDDHQPLPEATGAGLALPVWQDFISKSLTLPTWRHRFTKPDGIIEDRIDPTYGRPSINGMVMAFRAGTRPSGASIQRNSPGELVKSVEGDINGGAAGLRDGSEVPDIFAR
jgi:membrane peptidoglycan carboxypeptidase